MIDNELCADTTLADIVTRLHNPKRYIQRVLQNMEECGKNHGSVRVRIGITGTGDRPNYRIEPEHPERIDLNLLTAKMRGELPDERHKELEVQLAHFAAHFSAYNGNSHERLADGHLHEAHWSDRYMSLEEVRNMLRHFREYAKWR